MRGSLSPGRKVVVTIKAGRLKGQRLSYHDADSEEIGDRTRYLSVSNAGGLARKPGTADRRLEQSVRQPESLRCPTTVELTRQQFNIPLEPLRPRAQSADVRRYPCQPMDQLPDRRIQDLAPWRLVSDG